MDMIVKDNCFFKEGVQGLFRRFICRTKGSNGVLSKPEQKRALHMGVYTV
jgi:hypothetical protein